MAVLIGLAPLTVSGGGGMAAAGEWNLVTGGLVWVVIVALGVFLAGLPLLAIHARLRRAEWDELARATDRLATLERQLEPFLQETGGYAEWAAVKERDRERRRGRSL